MFVLNEQKNPTFFSQTLKIGKKQPINIKSKWIITNAIRVQFVKNTASMLSVMHYLSIIINPYHMGIGCTMQNCLIFSQNSQHFKGYLVNSQTNTRHVCTYLNPYSIVIPYIVMKFNYFDI